MSKYVHYEQNGPIFSQRARPFTMDADAQDLIAKLSTALAPTDREAFRRAAENELAA
jgi:hypothetical protein